MSAEIDWQAIASLCAALPLPEALRLLNRHLLGGLTAEIWPWDHQRRTASSIESTVRLNAPRLDEYRSTVSAASDLSLHGEVLGVLTVSGSPQLQSTAEEVIGRLADLLAVAVRASAAVVDAVAISRRARPLSVAAEMQWQSLPPTQFSVPGLKVTAAVEPAYGVGGDVFDYALNESRLFLAILDARGHGLRAATTSTVAASAMRRSRRDGNDLESIAAEIATSINALGNEEDFVSAVLVELDLTTWTGRWLSAGHLPPLIAGRTVSELVLLPTLPLGMVVGGQPSQPTAQHFELEPGQSLVLYSDGIVENGSQDDKPAVGDATFHRLLLERLNQKRSTVGQAARDVVDQLLLLTGPLLRDDATLLIASHAPGSDTG